MRNCSSLLVFSAVVLVLLCLLFNWTSVYAAAPQPTVSVQSGYYDDAFFLELSAPENGSVFYTTDGSIPTANSRKYTEPIRIEDRSAENNSILSVQNVVYDWMQYTPSSKPVPKGTVIRAVYVNDLGISSDVLTQTYFVGLEKPGYGYTLSLVAEPELLIGSDGIYVTGREYDEWYLSGSASAPAPEPNFEKELEIPAFLELLEYSETGFSQNIGMKLQGNTSRAEIKKRFTLVSRPEYGGSQTFDISLYNHIATHSVMLKYYFPDAIAGDLLSDRNLTIQKSIPVRVFLNGEYMYDAYMLERYDSTYFKQHYQIDHYQLFKDGIEDSDSTPNPEIPPYEEFMHWVATTDFSDPDQWEQFQKEADVQSYIDWMITNYFFCNVDFRDDHNQILWRSSFTGSAPLEDTRWRWCIYDIDALSWVENDLAQGSAESINIFTNHLQRDMHHTTLFPALRRNPDFCRMFVLSFMDVLNNNFSSGNVERVLAQYNRDLQWSDSYFLKRPDYAVQHLAEEFCLTGNLETVEITTADPSMGTVIVNTSSIDLTDGSWTGSYFTDYPITIAAEANEGYVFLGWKGAANTTDATITLSVDSRIELEAVFAEKAQ